MAAMKALIDEKMYIEIKEKETLFRSFLDHKKIKTINSYGLWLGIEFDSFEINKRIIDNCIANGVMTDWFLFASNRLRISPPLIISRQQIEKAAEVITTAIEKS
jgi:acetylornithine/succinyldiaminopimelate/putrescine aminotransferase